MSLPLTVNDSDPPFAAVPGPAASAFLDFLEVTLAPDGDSWTSGAAPALTFNTFNAANLTSSALGTLLNSPTSIHADLPPEVQAALRRDPLSTVIPMTILYALILIAGVIGNISTCIVIARNKYMRTATNYYLFSLAVSDLLLLILGLPQEMYMLWQPYPYVFGEFFCVTRGLTSETSTNASVLTITAFTVERFLAICYPLRAHTMSKLSRVVRLIVVVWLLAALGAVPLAVQFGLAYEQDEMTGADLADTAQCTLKRPLQHAFEISTLIFFVVPMTLILVLYMLIGIQLRKSEGLGRRGCDDRSQLASAAAKAAAARHSVPSNGSIVVSDNGSVVGTKFKSRRSWEGQRSLGAHRGPTNSNTSSRRAVIKMLSE